MESTRFEVPLPYVLETLRLQKLTVISEKNDFVIIVRDPHFWPSANIVLRPPIFESEIEAFSFRVLRTTETVKH